MRLPLRTVATFLCAALATAAVGRAQTSPQHSRGRTGVQTEVWANVRAQLSTVEAGAHGTAWLIVSARYEGRSNQRGQPGDLTLRIPLASTEDVYGESRSCSARPGGRLNLVFTAGMDEQNFMRFAGSGRPHDFHLLLNKYLCRALAAPFHCSSGEVKLPQDWAGWRLDATSHAVLEPASAARIELGSAEVHATATAFDRARCAVVAPSNGICCVAGKTTEWHCGGTPAGAGWHQVSGECFHRETGGSCTQ